MTDLEPQVVEALDRLFPLPVVVADWDGVLDGAGVRHGVHRKVFVRRRRLVLVALIFLLAALLVGPAFGLGERLLDLISKPPVRGETAHDLRSPVWSPDGRKLLFMALVRGNTFVLSTVNADGSGRHELMRGVSETTPAWSPDGRRLAIVRYAPGATPPRSYAGLLYVIDADGNGERLLARNVQEGHAVWSPDGRRIAFVRDRAGRLDVHVTNADGTGTHWLARGVRMSGSFDIGPAPAPAWSPDGQRIAFISNRAGTNDLYVMNADGSNQRRLTRNAASESRPIWSPDGRTITFTRRAGEHWSYDDDIYVIKADATRVRNLTHNPDDDYDPVWAADGKKIFFSTQRDGEDEIYVMNADGTRPRNLTRNRASDDAPALSPDGKQIAFVSARGGRPELFVMNVDGSDQRRLTQRP
jgi:Tol biopolymer transport system component